MSSLAERFAARFAGLSRVHGVYNVDPNARPDEKGKILGKRWTAHEPVTLETWERHLAGTAGLGIVPIRDDATAVFGAIDVDVYPLDLEALARAAAVFPVVVARTKSGGAHLYIFTSAPAPASAFRNALTQIAARLGFAGVEIFPKQTKLAGPDDDGSWINMPYSGGARSVRYGLRHDGAAMSPGEFLDAADRVQLDPNQLIAFQLALIGGAFSDGPPCLEALSANKGFGDWQNNSAFNAAVYLSRANPDKELLPLLKAFNETYLDPPLLPREVAQIAKSARKKAYSYKCKDMPICAACDRTTCVTRKFGVGNRGNGHDPGVTFGDLVKLDTEPPTWIWDVNGARLKLTTKQILNQHAFREAAVEALDVLTDMIKAEDWDKLVREKLAKVQRIDVPEDARRDGQVLVYLARFATARTKGRSIDEILLGKPFTDVEKKRTYFCAADFLAYLQANRFGGVSERDLYTILRDEDLEAHRLTIKGKKIDCWSVPAFSEQTEEFAVPRAASLGEPM